MRMGMQRLLGATHHKHVRSTMCLQPKVGVVQILNSIMIYKHIPTLTPFDCNAAFPKSKMTTCSKLPPLMSRMR